MAAASSLSNKEFKSFAGNAWRPTRSFSGCVRFVLESFTGSVIDSRQPRPAGVRAGFGQRGPAVEAASLPAVVLTSNRGLVKRADQASGAVHGTSGVIRF